MKLALLAAALPLAALAAPAAALPVPGTGLDVGVEAELMSDYRFRGISRSNENPALQGEVTVSHNSGIYVGARGTTLAGIDRFRFRDPNLRDLGDLQLDLYAGFSADLGAGLSADAGVLRYAFAGAQGRSDYFEPYASLSYMFGPIEATAGAKYAPAQQAIAGEDMLYVFGDAEVGIPLTGLTVTAHAGRQSWGRFGDYSDWSVGARYGFGPVSAGVRYVDTDLPRLSGQDPTVVLSLGVRF